MDSLLQVNHLTTSFSTNDGAIRAVDDVSFSVGEREILGIVGESGCGKSVTALSIMRLLPQPAGRIEGGSVFFQGQDLLRLSERYMRGIRGREMAMIFQDPVTSLNPVYTIGSQIGEAVRFHQRLGRREALQVAEDALAEVLIPDPGRCLRKYPHQLSGGMRQRAMIAMAVSCQPRLIIADEPTTALDVTVQAQILDLLQRLQHQRGMSVLLITHNLGVVAEIASRVLVMYAGQIVEQEHVKGLFEKPLHPYTKGLMASSSARQEAGGRRRLHAIPGALPDPVDRPTGCRFQTRCPERFDSCMHGTPDLTEVGEGHGVRCFRYSENPKGPMPNLGHRGQGA